MTKRQVWKTPKAGAIKRLRLAEEAMPTLARGMVRVHIRSVGLNFADIFALSGLYSATPKGAFIPGLEYSGTVIASDPSSGFHEGDRVMGVTRFGAYASQIDTDPKLLLPIPRSWSFQEGAAYLVQTLTAYYALIPLGALKEKQQVLVHSAAGGVGLQAMKLIKALGAIPVGTVSRPEKKDFLNSKSFEQVIIREENFAKQLKDLGLEFDLVLDGIGGSTQTASYNRLRSMGRLVVFGAAEFTPGSNRPRYFQSIIKYLLRPKYDVMEMISDNKSVLAFNLIWLWNEIPLLRELIVDMSEIKIDPPVVGHEFPFEEAHGAIECLRGGASIGKVILNLST